jgi:hypothetical protein
MFELSNLIHTPIRLDLSAISMAPNAGLRVQGLKVGKEIRTVTMIIPSKERKAAWKQCVD